MAALHRQVPEDESGAELDINPVYFREKTCEIPRWRLPERGVLPRTALQVVRDELILDGNARLNLATFVTTWMEPEAEELMAECSPKNMIDKDEYPQTAELEHRCVNILGHLWNAPHEEAIGCSTTGSSEACMLGGMALLWRWRAKRRAACQSCHGFPRFLFESGRQHGLRTDDGRAVHHPALPRIMRGDLMHRATVIPHHDIIR